MKWLGMLLLGTSGVVTIVTCVMYPQVALVAAVVLLVGFVWLTATEGR